jgi:hypothetical protein
VSKYDGHNWSCMYWEGKCKCQACREDRLDLHAKVSRGAELLDSAMPGWWLKVNIETLSMETTPVPRGKKHLAVQVLESPEVSESYDAFRILLGLSIDDAPKYGMWPQRHIGQALDRAWIDLILRRHVEIC